MATRKPSSRRRLTTTVSSWESDSRADSVISTSMQDGGRPCSATTETTRSMKPGVFGRSTREVGRNGEAVVDIAARTPSHEQVAYKVEHMKVDDGNLAHVLERRDVGERGHQLAGFGIGIAYQRLGADHLVVLIDLGLHVDGHRALCDGFRRAARAQQRPAPDSSQGFQPADRARARICFICLSFSSTSLAMLLTSRQVCCQA